MLRPMRPLRVALTALSVLAITVLATPSIVASDNQRSVGDTDAAALWYAGDTEGAIAAYRRLLDDTPDDREVRLSLIVLLREAGRPDEALELSGGFPRESAMNTALVGSGSGSRPTAPQAGDDSATGAGARGTETAGDDWRVDFWEGVAAMGAAMPETARDAFTRAIDAAPENHAPYAFYFLGLMDAAVGDDADARDAYLRALAQDPNLTDVFLPLAQAYWRLGEYPAAWDRLERARIALPWNTDIPALQRQWEAERPSLTAGGEERAAARRAAATPPRVATVSDAVGAAPPLRVGLIEDVESVYLKTGGPFTLSVGDDVFRSDAAGATELHASRDADGSIVVRDESGARLVGGTDTVRLEYDDRRFTTTIFDITFGRGQFRAGREDRSYRGAIELLPRGERFTVINRLSVEEYLYSVVPSEMPAWWPQEALRAQAIAARSYTLHPRGRYADRGFDLLSSIASAAYPGVTNEDPRTTAAVDATRGLVLLDHGRPLDAVYSANNAGYAEAAGSVWGWPNSLVVTSDPLLPPLDDYRSPAEVYRWLTSRPDSYAARQPYAAMSSYRWSLAVPREAIEARLAAVGVSVGTVLAVTPGPRGMTGRVEAVTITGTEGTHTVRRDAIRSRLGGLRSNLFVVSPYRGPVPGSPAPTDGRPPAGSRTPAGNQTPATAPAYFYFQGAGWGHGVGMCQTGAAGMAADGYDAEGILAQYYPRNELEGWY